MLRDKVVVKAAGAVEALLQVMGLFYAAAMPYPSTLFGTLLFVQEQVLKDVLHPKDKLQLTKFIKEMTSFRDNVSDDIFGTF
jgi:hypothetical protein